MLLPLPVPPRQSRRPIRSSREKVSCQYAHYPIAPLPFKCFLDMDTPGVPVSTPSLTNTVQNDIDRFNGRGLT